ncbi:MAG: FtsX-like permease family protein [Pyrinomonadaceae bacterium]|nr:FtsX-like permease family protein [Pyrinomonadaceae bacterium]
MKFIFNLTIREIRSSWKRLLFFFLCVAIGVGSVVALRSLIQNLSQVVGNDARALLTADLRITSTNDFSPTDISKIEEVIGGSGIVEARNETIRTSAMARPADPLNKTLQFVSLKGIEPPFPLVGGFVLQDGKEFDFKLLENRGAIVAPILLEELDIKIGDKILVGESEFTVNAAFEEEPGGTGGFRLGARVYVQKKAFDEAEITQNRSRITRRILYRTSDNPTALVNELREKLKGTSLRVQSYRETQDRISEQFDRTENYLSLTGLLILVLGGIGVWNVARVFVEQKRKSVAVLKCLGAKGTRIITVYILQILFLGLIGSLFGVLLAQIGLLFAKWNFNDALPAAMSYSVQLSTALQGVLLGILISLLFSVLPLLQVRTIKPNLLLRDENNQNLRKLDWIKWIFGLICLIGLLGLAAWQAGSFTVGIFFLVSLAVTSLVLYISATFLTWILKKLKNLGTFSIRQSINSLYRPGNQTRIILLAVGLGAFVVLAVQSLQTNLVREFDFSRNQNLPSLFFVDIQASQIEQFEKLVEEKIGQKAETIPTVRARISHINGRAIDYQQRSVRQQQGQIGREFAVTYRDNLDKNESIVDGEWWQGNSGSVPQVSIEEQMAERLKVGAGDSITFDISGRKLTAQIANVRQLDLRKTRTVFIFVFRPGVLEKAPQSFAANVLKRLPSKERQRLQRDVVDQFPNVQIFDVAEIVAVVQNLVNNFVMAISFVGSFVILSGILILIGSIGLTKSQRVYENAILKTLGAKRLTLTSILFAEYGILGIMAGIIGAFFATALSYAVSKYVLEIEWVFDPMLTIYGVILTAVLVMLVGAIASFDVLFKKPLKTLRMQ